jgi:hypothetical protein
MAPRIESAHDHPIEGRVIVVHSMGPITDGLRVENPAHAFGPFDSEQAARDWDASGNEDDCFKVILDLFEPR